MIGFVRRRQSLLIAAVAAAGLAAWLASGELSRDGAAAATPREAPAAAPAGSRSLLFRVRVRRLDSEPVSREVVIYGRTEPSRAVTLRAEIDGRVVALGAQRGSRVHEGDVLVRLDRRDREARLAEAKARVELRRIQYEAARQLSTKNFQSEAALAEAAANLAAARAAVRRVEVELGNTVLRAPFDGILERRPVEIGDFVREGSEVARIIDPDPILVTGDVTQQELRYLSVGDEGRARLITGERISGKVRYVSAESDQSTRTFRVEVEVANPGGALPSGVTAELRIPTESRRAHRVPASLLALDENEVLGVKTVDARGLVAFHPVEVVRAEGNGLWVDGLPDPVDVIVVGQGFVHPGDRVEPVPVEPAERAAAATTPGAGG